jgi:hypothetical protein
VLNGQVDQILVEDLDLIYLLGGWALGCASFPVDLRDLVEAFTKLCLDFNFIGDQRIGRDANLLDLDKDVLVLEKETPKGLCIGEVGQKSQGLQNDSLRLWAERFPNDEQDLVLPHVLHYQVEVWIEQSLLAERSWEPKNIFYHTFVASLIFADFKYLLEQSCVARQLLGGLEDEIDKDLEKAHSSVLIIGFIDQVEDLVIVISNQIYDCLLFKLQVAHDQQ